MPELMHLLFAREALLRAALLEVKSEALFSPYRLFSWIPLEAGAKPTLLVECEEGSLPEGWAKRVLPLDELPLRPSPQEEPPSASALRIRTKEADIWAGEASWIREGSCLFSLLGLERSPSWEPIAGFLYDLPLARLPDVVAQHLALEDDDLRCMRQSPERAWLWVRKPSFFLAMSLHTQEGIFCYQSFADSPQLFSPWGERSRITAKTTQSTKLFLVEATGKVQSLETSSWWAPPEMIVLSEPPLLLSHSQDHQMPKIPIRIDFRPTDTKEIPVYWWLREERVHEVIEQLFLRFAPEERELFFLAILKDKADQTLFFLHDARLHRDAPLFYEDEAIGFTEVFPSLGFYLQHGYRLFPVLPSSFWASSLSLQRESLTFLAAPDGKDAKASLHSIPRSFFQPLARYLHYQMTIFRPAITSFILENPMSLFFTPLPLPSSLLGSENKAPKEKLPAQAPPPPQSIHPREPSGSKREGMSGFDRTSAQALQRLEDRLRQKILRNEHPHAVEWLELAQLYAQAYRAAREGARRRSDLEEAFKALGEILSLDVKAVEAVALERSLLEESLAVLGLPIAEQQQRLGEILSGDDLLYRRLAFRLRGRLLLDQRDGFEEEVLRWRLQFYRDLAALEDLLLPREHYIYVQAVASRFGDTELEERARTRYRHALQRAELLQSELPRICVL
jgi:hypothetical protein